MVKKRLVNHEMHFFYIALFSALLVSISLFAIHNESLTGLSVLTIQEATNVSACGTPLNSPNTVYALNESVNSSGTCFNIGANNVTLDCQGFTITYGDSSNTHGVEIPEINSTTIKNCNIVQENSSVTASYGVLIFSGSFNNILNNTITTNGTDSDGVSMTVGDKLNNTVIGNTIVLNGNNTVEGNAIANFGGGSNIIIMGNNVTVNGRSGINLEASNSSVINNTVMVINGDGGISVSGTNFEILGNNVTMNGSGVGISLNSNDRLKC